VAANGPPASQGTFADAAAFGELLFNCTAGVASLQALEMAGVANLRGKSSLILRTRWTFRTACRLP